MPLPGAVLEEGAEFSLFVSGGPLFRLLPEVEGLTADAAAATLADLNSPMMRPRRQKPRNYRRLATIGVDTSDEEEEEEVPRPFVRTDLASIDGIDPSTIAFLAAIACSM